MGTTLGLRCILFCAAARGREFHLLFRARGNLFAFALAENGMMSLVCNPARPQ